MSSGLAIAAGVLIHRSTRSSDTDAESARPASVQIDLATREPDEPPLRDVQVYHSGPIVLPHDRVLSSPDEAAALHATQTQEAVRCLQDRGVELGSIPTPEFAAPDNGRSYGISSLAEAEVYGYGVVPVSQASPVQSFVDGLTPEELDALSQCDLNARRTVGRTRLDDLDGRLSEIFLTAFERSLADSRARRAAEAWSACMSERGYAYETPLDPSSDPRWGSRGEGTGPTSDEIATAVADIECQRRVNYVGIMQAIETAYQEQALADHPELVEAYRAQVERILARAG